MTVAEQIGRQHSPIRILSFLFYVFVIQIYEAQDCLLYMSEMENVTTSKMVSMAIACLIPPREILTQVIASVKVGFLVFIVHYDIFVL